jgi:8-oxo-dGTP diphosphatase
VKLPSRGLRAALAVFRVLPEPLRLLIVRLAGPSFFVGTIVVIERADGAVLLVRHSYKERWGFPGGLLNRGEDAAVGARRETVEEVGLAVELIGVPLAVVEPRERRVDVVFRARPRPDVDPATAAPHSPEIVRCEWFGPGDLPDLQPEAAGALVAIAQADASASTVAGDQAGRRG